MRAALFTSYHPEIGGGAVNFRSLLPHLSGIDVTWFHLGAPVPDRIDWVSLGAAPGGAESLAGWWRTPAMWAGAMRRTLGLMAERICQGGFDAHWVLAMDEGILLGLELTRRAPMVPLHVSIQDDQEHALFGRSRRHRWLARFTRLPFRRLLKAARTVDVTSEGMRRHYAAEFGLESIVVHPVVDAPVPSPDALAARRDPTTLRLGHIGTAYSAPELRMALRALRKAAQELQREPVAHFIGLASRYRRTVESAGVRVELTESLPEPQAIAELARCDVVYAMQPFDRASTVFVRTSLPTKLTTYIQTGRPLLVQAPVDSTLAETAVAFGAAAMRAGNDARELADAIKLLTGRSVPPARFTHLAEDWFGLHNARDLGNQLRMGGAGE